MVLRTENVTEKSDFEGGLPKGRGVDKKERGGVFEERGGGLIPQCTQ